MAQAIFVLILLLALGCTRRGVERVVGDFGSQPETIVNAMPGHEPDVSPVIESAKKVIGVTSPRVWPEPTRVDEGQDRWDVWFEYRKTLVEIDGEQHVMSQKPKGFKVEVQKSNLSAKVIPGR